MRLRVPRARKSRVSTAVLRLRLVVPAFSGASGGCGRDGPKRLAGVLIGCGAGDIRAHHAGQQLNIEDFFHSRVEFQMGCDGSGSEINHPKSAAQLVAIGHDGDSFQCRTGFREADEGIPAVQGQTARNARQCGHGSQLTGQRVGHGQVTVAGVEKKYTIAFHPWGVGEAEPASQQAAAGYLNEAAAMVLGGAPPGRRVGFRQGGDIAGLAVDDGQAIEMAAVLGAQGGYEWRPPARGETIQGMQGRQAGEKSIDDPELTAPRAPGVRGSPDPGRFVRLDVIGEVGGARQEAGVKLSRVLELGGDIRSVPQEPHFLARADGDRSGLDDNAHGSLELVKRQRKSAFPGRHHHEVSGLIGGDQDRQAQSREQRRETVRMGTADVAVFLDRFWSWSRHGSLVKSAVTFSRRLPF